MTIILWIKRTQYVDIGEQRIYSKVVNIFESINEYSHPTYNIKYLMDKMIYQTDVWLIKDIIKIEILND